MIEITNVNFSYKGSTDAGLHDVSLHIHDGETVLLCGASGCGKATILRLINGLIPHYYKGDLSGSMTISGQDIAQTELYELANVVGTVFQNPRSQFFSVDTDGEITFGTENIGIPPAKILRRKAAVVEEFALEPLLNKSLFALSGGEKQKIACASVSALMPEVMLLDEPSSNLDWNAISELAEVIRKWKAQGKTIVISEHRLWYLKDWVDRVIFLENGTISHEWSRQEFSGISAGDLSALGLRPVRLEEQYISEFSGDLLAQYHAEPIKAHDDDVQICDLYFTYQPPKYVLWKTKLCAEHSGDYTLAVPELWLPCGSVIGLIGRNGAGKSTFLRCLCGLEKD